MTSAPLPTGVAAAARSYLAAFLDGDEVADAMHEVVADATYWGDSELGDVLAVAHAVLGSRQRVTPDAARACLEELGLDPQRARRLVGMPPAPSGIAASAQLPPAAGAEATGDATQRWLERSAEPADTGAGGAGDGGVAAPESPAAVVRIGFDEADEPEPIYVDDEPEERRSWWALAIAALLVVVAIVLLTRA